jgi:hypothetical protein
MQKRTSNRIFVLLAAFAALSYQINSNAALSDDFTFTEGLAAFGAAAAAGTGIVLAVLQHHSSGSSSGSGGGGGSDVIPDNYLPLEITNNTHIADNDHLYILIKGSTDGGKTGCFMNLADKSTGKAVCEQAVAGQYNNFQYSYPLSQLHVDPATNLPRVFLPQNTTSARIYFAINNQFDLHVDANSNIVDPDGFNLKDPNYYTLYDKVEFTYTDKGNWINPTAVDFFSMPIAIAQAGSQSGFTQAGLTATRATVLQTIQNLFAAQDLTAAKVWNNLFVKYDGSTVLRLMSPGKAMANGGSTQFDPMYLDNAIYGFNYTNNLWGYYAALFSNGNYLEVDCSELQGVFALDNYIFRGTIVGTQFVFKNQTSTYTVTIDRPSTSQPFFAGAGDSFAATNNTPKAIIVRDLTAAFDVGLLPAQNVTLSKNYFVANKGQYYTVNPLLPAPGQSTGRWYDLYSQALHSFGVAQPIYTFAYDDILGQDGTLHDPNALRPSQVNVTLGDMSGTSIPTPCVDSAKYTVTPALPSGTQVTYNGQVLTNGQAVANVSVPFHVTVTNTATAKSHEVDICIKNPLVHPDFNGASGIVVGPVAPGNAVTITFPANIGIL